MKPSINDLRQWIILFGVELAHEIKAWRSLYLVRRPLMLALMVYASLLVGFRNDQKPPKNPSNHVSYLNGAFTRITGVVHRFPETRMKGTAFQLRVEQIETFDIRQAAQGLVYVDVRGSLNSTIAPGDRLCLRGKLLRPSQAKVTGSFDLEKWLATKNIHSIIYTSSRFIEHLGNSGDYGLWRWGWDKHERIRNYFETHLSPNAATVLSGLTIGNRPRRNEEIKQLFSQTGAMHVLVASGSNIAFVTILTCLVIRLFTRVSRVVSLLGALPVIWAYAIIVGLDAPIVRSSTMASLAILYAAWHRFDSPLYLWSLAAFGFLIVQPDALFDVGFQMSFATVFGLLHWVVRPMPNSGSGHIRTWLWLILWTSITAQIWLFPITANVFRALYPLAPLFNVIIMPLAAGGLMGGTLLLASKIHPFIETMTAFIVNQYLEMFIGIVRLLATFSPGPIWIAPMTGAQITSWYSACVLAPFVTRFKSAQILLTLALLVGFGCWGVNRVSKPKKNISQIIWLDVGRQLTILVRTPDTPTLQINPPSQQQQNRVVLPYCAVHRISIETTTFVNQGEMRIFNVKGKTMVIGNPLSLAHQRHLIANGAPSIDILQTRFSPKTKWDTQFLKHVNPQWLIDTGVGSPRSAVHSPWPHLTIITPQTLGELKVEWPANKLPATAHNPKQHEK